MGDSVCNKKVSVCELSHSVPFCEDAGEIGSENLLMFEDAVEIDPENLRVGGKVTGSTVVKGRLKKCVPF